MTGLLTSKELVKQEYSSLKEVFGNNAEKKMLIIISNPDDKASKTYVKLKEKKCKEFGISVTIVDVNKYNSNAVAFYNDILKMYKTFVSMKYKVGIMVQRPTLLSFEFAEDKCIPERADVDGTTAYSLGALAKDNATHKRCTPNGIMELLEHYNISLSGKDVLIVNRSNILGKPLALMMMHKDATVTVAHSKTKGLKEKCKNADIVVTGISNRDVFTPDYFKEGAVIIDASTNSYVENGENKVSGDIKKEYYDELLKKGCKLTPVPGGVGPMTILSLIKNILFL